MSRIAIYPGSFDPVTNGHIDIAKRGMKLFDHIIVAILHNPGKQSLFTIEERLEMLNESMSGIDHIEFDTFDGLLVEIIEPPRNGQDGGAGWLGGVGSGLGCVWSADDTVEGGADVDEVYNFAWLHYAVVSVRVGLGSR